ncbi:MAG: nuclear transport factor 2 family protein [Rhodobacteraceae bacterium]|nr:nuclear transport factor 2 family protein [Paracoccaceae bacterium]
MSDLAFFLSLETRVWDALTTGDMASDQALLAPDFLGVYSTGFSDRAEHVGQLANGPSVANYVISQARLLKLGAGQVLLAYRADFTRVGSSTSEAMYVSSIWEERKGLWQNTFSQDSNASDPAPV